jgi:enterochelin esterase-like enzyme
MKRIATIAGIALVTNATMSNAQMRPPRIQDTLKSPVVNGGSVLFQLFAPKATQVVVRTEGPAPFADKPLTKSEAGVWSLSATAPADLYIYWFDIDGVSVADPRNNRPRVNLATVRSLLEIPGAGSAFFAERTVPHGSVADVYYHSKSLDAPRRMQVYTPPGYGASDARYPVLFLLHGAFDDDQSWLMAGRANFILDNLIAEGKAKPMIVVMPAGHTTRAGGLFGPPGSTDPFIADFLGDIVPYVERNYRVLPGRAHRAIAGLSMGGWHTLMIGLPNLDKFSHLGVFSSGLLRQNGVQSFAQANRAVLADPKVNEKLKLFWIATGKDDFLMPATKETLALFDQHKIRYVYKETEGGHTWPNWRAYLNEFVPMLFR